MILKVHNLQKQVNGLTFVTMMRNESISASRRPKHKDLISVPAIFVFYIKVETALVDLRN